MMIVTVLIIFETTREETLLLRCWRQCGILLTLAGLTRDSESRFCANEKAASKCCVKLRKRSSSETHTTPISTNKKGTTIPKRALSIHPNYDSSLKASFCELSLREGVKRIPQSVQSVNYEPSTERISISNCCVFEWMKRLHCC